MIGDISFCIKYRVLQTPTRRAKNPSLTGKRKSYLNTFEASPFLKKRIILLIRVREKMIVIQQKRTIWIISQH